MDMFVLDEVVTQWEVALLPLRGAARLAVLAPLAWHLRQRDTARASALADEALALLPQSALTPLERLLMAARLNLVHAEALWLQGELDAADALAGLAWEELSSHHDHAGCADATGCAPGSPSTAATI